MQPAAERFHTLRRLAPLALILAALSAGAGTELIEEVETRSRSEAPPPETASRAGGFVQSTLQVGCEGIASRTCRRASVDVQIGSITRINEASGGTAIQETLIGTAR